MWWSFHKNPKTMGFIELLSWWTHLHPGKMVLQTSKELLSPWAPALKTLPDFALCTPSSGCSSVSFIISFIINHKCKQCFSDLCEPSSKLLNWRKKLWEYLTYSQLVRSTEKTSWDLLLTSEVGGGQSCGIEPLTCLGSLLIQNS